MAESSDMEETTLTDRTDMNIELYVFVEDDTMVHDTVRQADRRSCALTETTLRNDFVLTTVLI